MRFSSILPALALTVTVTALPSGHKLIDSGIKGAKIIADYEAPYPIDEPQWEVQVFPGKERQLFSGAIEDVYAEVLALNPSYLENSPGKNATLDNTQVEKRDVAGNPVCHGHLNGAHIGRFQEGVFYLDRLNAYLNVAPRRCTRVSCSYGAGIALCNDRHDITWALHTSLVISYVVRISNSCLYFGVDMAGQQFDTGGFNVIAVRMNCNAGSGWNVGTWPP